MNNQLEPLYVNDTLIISAKYGLAKRTNYDNRFYGENIPHKVDQFELFINTKGSHTVLVNDVTLNTTLGDMVLFAPFSRHYCKCFDDNSEYLLLQIHPRVFEMIKLIPHLLTDLSYWFLNSGNIYPNKIKLNEKQLRHADEIWQKYDAASGYAMDIMRFSALLDFLVYISIVLQKNQDISMKKK